MFNPSGYPTFEISGESGHFLFLSLWPHTLYQDYCKTLFMCLLWLPILFWVQWQHRSLKTQFRSCYSFANNPISLEENPNPSLDWCGSWTIPPLISLTRGQRSEIKVLMGPWWWPRYSWLWQHHFDLYLHFHGTIFPPCLCISAWYAPSVAVSRFPSSYECTSHCISVLPNDLILTWLH